MAQFRLKNPYYRYRLAEQALAKRELTEAQQHIRAAIQYYKDDHSFHFLAAKIYAAKGDNKNAERSLARAAKLTIDNNTRLERISKESDTLLDKVILECDIY